MLLQKRRYIPTSPGCTGLGQQLLEFGFAVARKLRWLTMRLFGSQPKNPFVSIRIDPALNESATAIQAKANLRFAQSLQSQNNCAITIPLFRVRFLSNHFPKGGKILRPLKRYLHDGFLSDGDIAIEQSAIFTRIAQP